jgi:hypothetical protein
MTYQQIIELILPLLAGLVTTLLQQDRLPDWANAIIALVGVGAAAVGTAFLGGQLTGDVRADILIVVSAAVALQTVPWATPLFDWLRTHTSIGKPAQPTPPPSAGGAVAAAAGGVAPIIVSDPPKAA